VVPVTDLFLQLSDELRLEVVRVLDEAATELCVAEIVDVLQRPQYAVSRALRQLLRSGVVAESRQGRLVYYRVTDEPWWPVVRQTVRLGVEDDREWLVIRDRLRWRLDIRRDGRCVVTYPKEKPVESDKRRVLFVCVHNSARSQMAEEYLRRAAGDVFLVESAGLEPGTLNPYVVKVLAEDGIDISGKETRDVFDVYRSGKTFAYVVTVCSREAEEKCPIFPGPAVRLNWPFTDPSGFTGTEEEILAQTREIRDEVKNKIDEFVASYRHRHETGEEHTNG
jgi:arsenate reductase